MANLKIKFVQEFTKNGKSKPERSEYNSLSECYSAQREIGGIYTICIPGLKQIMEAM